MRSDVDEVQQGQRNGSVVVKGLHLEWYVHPDDNDVVLTVNYPGYLEGAPHMYRYSTRFPLQDQTDLSGRIGSLARQLIQEQGLSMVDQKIQRDQTPVFDEA